MTLRPELGLNENDKLRPCPFCGGEDLEMVVDEERQYRQHPEFVVDYTVFIRCNHCKAQGTTFACEPYIDVAKESAINNWNRAGVNPTWYEKAWAQFSHDIEFLNKFKG